MAETESDLASWMSAEGWRSAHASSIFHSPSSWDWFKRQHRRKLVESGVLFLGAGRKADCVDSKRIGEVVSRILKMESLIRIGEPVIAPVGEAVGGGNVI